MSHPIGTSTGSPAALAAPRGVERLTLLRAVAGSISGRGRVLGPSGGWVRVDFDDIRQHMQSTG
jgi:hypothetical protein